MSDPASRHNPVSASPIGSRSLSAEDSSVSPHQPELLQQGMKESVSSGIGSSSGISDYPLLDAKQLTKDQKEELEARLTIEYENITDLYSELTEQIISSLVIRNVTPKDLAIVLMNLNAYTVVKDDNPKQPLLRDCLDKIREASSLNDAFYTLHPYGSFFDCHIISRIVNSNLCTNDDRDKLNQYTKRLDDYCKRNIFECPCLVNSDVDSDLPNCKLALKVGNIVSSSFTGNALTKFQAKIAMSLGIEVHTLIVRSVEAGCVKLTFQIPRFVAEAIFPLPSEVISSLKLLGVMNVVCEGFADYDLSSQTTMGASKVMNQILLCCDITLIIMQPL